jgi:thiamine monophosphate synthase
MMVTTIQLNESTKNSLLQLREKKETYEEIILNLIKLTELQKRKQEELLIEECKEMYDENLKIAKEWEGTLMDGLDKNERWEF